MIVNCTACGELLGSVFIFVDRHTRLCLDCGEKHTAAIDRHPAGKQSNTTKEIRHDGK